MPTLLAKKTIWRIYKSTILANNLLHQWSTAFSTKRSLLSIIKLAFWALHLMPPGEF
jgi:hypothetical protein